VLADEINRATPKTQSALLEAMQERSVTVAKGPREAPPPFFVLATQNPIEMEGTYPLPEAQLDRFLFKVVVIALTRQVPVASHLVEHAVALVMATHPTQETATDHVKRFVRFGASPRGAQALVLTAKAAALLDGRPNVSAADIRSVAPAVLRHRLVLGYEAPVEGVDADDVVRSVLDAVPEPAVGIRGAP
jgi:MoxR-like ATPase